MDYSRTSQMKYASIFFKVAAGRGHFKAKEVVLKRFVRLQDLIL